MQSSYTSGSSLFDAEKINPYEEEVIRFDYGGSEETFPKSTEVSDDYNAKDISRFLNTYDPYTQGPNQGND